jgi:4-diphosphocytidyl-2-C-methyl-D-erythritol kinase
LADEVGRGPLSGLRITVEKNVPTQAGLGGGSADAMAMVRALGCWWGLELDRELLVALGRRLGADVPFFVEGGTALGTGRGDELTPLPDLPTHALAIVKPPFGVATTDAYRWVVESRPGLGAAHRAERAVAWPADRAGWAGALSSVANDFEPVIAPRFPAVSEISSTLGEAGAVVAFLSGSGSAVVGLFESHAGVEAAERAFEPRSGWEFWKSETVDRSMYGAAVAPTLVDPSLV